MARTYLPVLLLFGFALLNAILMIGFSALVVRPRRTPEKSVPYESGVTPYGDTRARFSISFYLIAMLFIVFDLETVFMIPWAVAYKDLSCSVPLVNGACPAGQTSFYGLGAMLVFLVILAVVFIYEWKKGTLRWD